MIKYHGKKQPKGKKFIWFTIPGDNPLLQVSQSIRNLKQLVMLHHIHRWEQRGNKWTHTHLCSAPFLLFTFQDILCLVNGAAHCGLSLPTSINIIRAIPLGQAHKAPWPRQTLLRLPSLEMLGCSKFTIKTVTGAFWPWLMGSGPAGSSLKESHSLKMQLQPRWAYLKVWL